MVSADETVPSAFRVSDRVVSRCFTRRFAVIRLPRRFVHPLVGEDDASAEVVVAAIRPAGRTSADGPAGNASRIIPEMLSDTFSVTSPSLRITKRYSLSVACFSRFVNIEAAILVASSASCVSVSYNRSL